MEHMERMERSSLRHAYGHPSVQAVHACMHVPRVQQLPAVNACPHMEA